ncbi:DUF397 domain-containing protein [Polymorphospora sp. NPDC050346]|uniref:DUF397 domain-containing protein n=1 Tax=Polymorphospora sp. NPDC050346 TaxID=3155780 RepID=UPI003410B84C
MFSAPENDELRWFTSSRSAGNGQCVEVAVVPGVVAVRDSKDPHSPILRFDAGTWQNFVTSVRSGDLANG